MPPSLGAFFFLFGLFLPIRKWEGFLPKKKLFLPHQQIDASTKEGLGKTFLNLEFFIFLILLNVYLRKRS